MGQLFWLSPKLRDFRHAKTPKIAEFLKKIGLFLKENPQKWVPFLAKITLKDVYGFWGSSGTPLSNSNQSTPQRFWFSSCPLQTDTKFTIPTPKNFTLDSILSKLTLFPK